MAETSFIAYAGDCLLQARIDVPDDRLSDYVNSTGSFVLHDVVLQAHDDGRLVRRDRLVIPRNEVFAIQATGLRGSAQRRITTTSSRMEFVLGAYRVLGLLHARPGADPVTALARRQQMVPLTAATIAYHVGRETRLHDIATLIVNRELVESVSEQALDIAFEGMPVLAASRDAGLRPGSALA